MKRDIKKAIFALIICMIVNGAISTTIKDDQDNGKKHKILVYMFPGGKSHSFVYKDLLLYTIKKRNNLEVHMILHNTDYAIWKDIPGLILYPFGDIAEYKEEFEKAMKESQIDPIFGYWGFQKSMIYINVEFLKSGLIEKLRKIKFDLLLTDIPCFINKFVHQELKIPKNIYLNPTCLQGLYYELLEFNPAVMPSIGTPFNDDMNFLQRVSNSFFIGATKVMYRLFMIHQASYFPQYGYTVDSNVFIHKSMMIYNCAKGYSFPYPAPPNVKNLGPFLIKPSNEITDPIINSFLTKYKKVIYISQGTIFKVISLELINEVCKKFKEYGFIFSYKDKVDINPEPNLLIQKWIPQNDLLGREEVKLFVSHGGANSVYESIYHKVPLIVIGIALDQISNGVIVEKRKIGKHLTHIKNLDAEYVSSVINEVVSNKIYKTNVEKISEIIKHDDSKKSFDHWLNYALDQGYEHLLVKAYTEYNYIQFHNIDVYLVMFLTLCATFLLIRKGMRIVLPINKIQNQMTENIK